MDTNLPDPKLLGFVLTTLTNNARALGTQHGTTAAGWRFDGNTSTATYQRCVDLDHDGDPAWDSEFAPLAPIRPDDNSSEEGSLPWLLAELNATDLLDDQGDPTGHARYGVINLYSDAYRDAYRAELLRVAASHLNTAPGHTDDKE